MRALVKLAVVAGAAAFLACQPTGTTGNAGLPGAHSLALVGDLLFITATDTNELRVLDLSASPVTFVKAPNPLYSLSIPVANRPVALANDVVWSNDGVKGAGNWVYSLSANGQEISLVGAGRADGLVEAKRLKLKELLEGQMTTNATITAIAARGNGDSSSTLYLGAFDGAKGRLFTVTIPASLEGATLKATPALEAPCGAVRALLVMPGDALAFSTSCADATGDSAWLRDGTTVAGTPGTPLKFAYPTRMLTTNPAAEGLEAGSLIYGVYDEQSCGGAPTCRGLSAVIARDNVGFTPESGVACGLTRGQPACDHTRFPMPTIDVGDALVMGVEIAPANSFPKPENALPSSRLVGILTTSDGRLVFMNADSLAPLDLDSAPPGVAELTVTQGANGTLPSGVAANATGILSSDILLTDGAARTDTISVVYGGELPGLTRIGYPKPTGMAAEIPIPVDPTNLVQLDDVVELSGGEGCNTTVPVTVTGVVSTPGAYKLQVNVVPTPTVDCLMTVRAGISSATGAALRPWVVSGAAAGYMGRMKTPATDADESFEWPPADANWTFDDPNPAYAWDLRLRAYYAHPGSPVGGEIPPAVQFTFKKPFGEVIKAEEVNQYVGLRYTFRVDAHYNPAATRVSQARVARNLYPVNVAGTVVYRPGEERLYVAFPSGNAVIEIEPGSVKLGGEIENARDYR